MVVSTALYEEAVESTYPNSGLSILSALCSLPRIGIRDHLLLILNHNLRSGCVVLHTIYLVGLHIVEAVNEWKLLQLHGIGASETENRKKECDDIVESQFLC